MSRNPVSFCLGLLAVSSVLFTACDSDSGGGLVKTPSLTVSTAVLTASYDRETYSFAYMVSNPVPDGELECVTDVSWITGLNEESGNVFFTVEENPGEQREGNIMVSYVSWKEQVSISETILVRQSSVTAPTITITPSALTAEVEGGAGSFNYTITNPSPDGVVSCSVDEEWISNLDSSVSGTVSFEISENQTFRLRTAEIAVTYRYSNGSVVETATVIQDHLASMDISELVGTYTASGKVVNPEDEKGIDVMDAEWTVKIFLDGNVDGYDLYIDGISYEYEGSYDSYGDHRYSARANYEDGCIVIPTQVITSTTVNQGGTTYYFAYTPCVAYSSEGFYASTTWPPVTFAALSLDTWESDYGLMAMGCTTTSISSISILFDASIPFLTLKKVSSSTNAVVPDAGRHSTYGPDGKFAASSNFLLCE